MTRGHEEWAREQLRLLEEHQKKILAILEKVVGPEGMARIERAGKEPHEQWRVRFTAWLEKMREGRPPWTREDAERWFRKERERREALGSSSTDRST